MRSTIALAYGEAVWASVGALKSRFIVSVQRWKREQIRNEKVDDEQKDFVPRRRHPVVRLEETRSVACHFLFLMGSILFVWLAVWDIQDEQNDRDNLDNNVVLSSFVNLTPHVVLSAAAALCLVIESVLQILTLRKAAKEAGQGRSRYPEIALSVSFGLGAFLAFLSAVTEDLDDNERISNMALAGAEHFYLITTVILLTWKKQRFYTLGNKLESAGDMFFACGSLLDVALSYFHFYGTTDDESLKIANRGNLLAAVLWLLDAILYIAADYFYVNEGKRSRDRRNRKSKTE